MPECPNCQERLQKVHRRFLEKLAYSSAYECRKCNFRTRRLNAWGLSLGRFIFSRHTSCPRCGTALVHRTSKRDRVESLSKHLFSRMQQLLGAPLNKCPLCRLQYYDVRPVLRATDLNEHA